MKKIWMLLIALALLVLCLGSAALAEEGWVIDGTHIFYYQNGEKVKDTTIAIDGPVYSFTAEGYLIANERFVNVNGRIYYLNSKNRLLSGWQDIGGKRYYFDPGTKAAYTWGIQTIDGQAYAFNPDGSICINCWPGNEYGWSCSYYGDSEGHPVTGYQTIDGKKYLFGDDGYTLVGFQSINGEIHYFYPEEIHDWLNIGNGFYYFDPETGVMQTSPRVIDGKRYRFRIDGSAILSGNVVLKKENGRYGRYYGYNADTGKSLSGWQTIDGFTYYFSSYDGQASTGRQQIDEEYYCFAADGKMQTNYLWRTDYGDICYFGADGKQQTGWVTVNGDTYYFSEYGWAYKYGHVIDGNDYYFDEEGKMYTGLMSEGDDFLVYYGNDGKRQMGWVRINNDVYYFHPNAFQNGTYMIDGIEYTFDKNGVLISGNAPDFAKDISSATVTATNRTYTGNALTSTITVTLDDIELAQGIDYTISYKNNVNVGTATATITGCGTYKGTITKKFRIVAKDLSKAIVTAANKAYTGSARETTVTVELSGRKLVKGTDFNVAYTNNVEIGTATATITGIGNYKGTASTTFKIVTRDLSGAAVTASNRTYTGSTVGSTIIVKIDGRTLVKGTDYTVKYSNNINVGTATAAITGIGNYKGTATKTFNILPKDLSGAVVTTQNRTYTGKTLEPPVTVELNDKALVKDTDYTIAYKNNVNVGTATITVTGTGNYTGTVTKNFRVVAKDLSGAALSASNKAYTGSARETSVTAVLGSVTLVQGTDFTVAYENNTEVGTATATITGAGNYKGTASTTFKIVTRDLSGATVTASNRTYTGSAVGSTITVKLDGRILVKGTDYKVSYKDNVNVGTATVTITGIGNYKGSTSKTFNILPIDLSGATVTVQGRTYTGNALEPPATVTLNGKTLAKGTDYNVKYSNNVNVGTATITVTGIGNYGGTASKTFKVVAKDLSGATVTAANRAYTGSERTTTVTAVLNGVTLTQGTDYTVSYANNVEVGTATVTITGKGNYKGTESGTFKVVTRDLSGATVTTKDRIYTGSTVGTTVTVVLDGKTLVKGTDFTVKYANNINVGTATATIMGIGNYKGTITATFRITEK